MGLYLGHDVVFEGDFALNEKTLAHTGKHFCSGLTRVRLGKFKSKLFTLGSFDEPELVFWRFYRRRFVNRFVNHENDHTREKKFVNCFFTDVTSCRP